MTMQRSRSPHRSSSTRHDDGAAHPPIPQLRADRDACAGRLHAGDHRRCTGSSRATAWSTVEHRAVLPGWRQRPRAARRCARGPPRGVRAAASPPTRRSSSGRPWRSTFATRSAAPPRRSGGSSKRSTPSSSTASIDIQRSGTIADPGCAPVTRASDSLRSKIVAAIGYHHGRRAQATARPSTGSCATPRSRRSTASSRSRCSRPASWCRSASPRASSPRATASSAAWRRACRSRPTARATGSTSSRSSTSCRPR